MQNNDIKHRTSHTPILLGEMAYLSLRGEKR